MRLILSGRHPRNSTYATESGQVLYKVDKPNNVGPRTATIRKAVGTVHGIWQGNLDQLPRSPTSVSSSSASRGNRAKWRGRSGSSDNTASKGASAGSHRDSQLVDVGDDRRRSSIEDQAFADSDDEEEEGALGEEPRSPVYEGHFAFYAQIDFKTFLSSRFRFDSRDVSVKEYFRKEGWSWYGRGRVFKAKDGKEYRWEMRTMSLVMVSNDRNKTELVRFRQYRPGLGALAKPSKAYLEIDDSCEGILDEIIMTFIYCHKLRKDRQRQTWSSGPEDILRNH